MDVTSAAVIGRYASARNLGVSTKKFPATAEELSKTLLPTHCQTYHSGYSPIMTRAAKQKLARQSTAAYAASQPLFTAIKVGCDLVGEQRANLAVSRDIVQNLHVKIRDETSKSDMSKHERYIDHCVKAWQSASQIYTNIFTRLAEATAAEPSEGKEEKEGHAQFAQMAETAFQAQNAANGFELYSDRPKPEQEVPKDQGDTSEASEIESEEESDNPSTSGAHNEKAQPEPSKTTPTNTTPRQTASKRSLPQEHPSEQDDERPQKSHRVGESVKSEPKGRPKKQPNQAPQNVVRLSEKIKYDPKTGKKIFWERGAKEPLVPFGTLGSSEKKGWKAELARQRREKKREKRAEQRIEKAKNEAEEKGSVEDASKPAHDRDYISLYGGPEQHKPEAQPSKQAESTVPSVEYEDVSAEVEERLKAKQARKEAAKKEKKRKRESGDSLEANGEPEPEKGVEKPKKKKPKNVDGEAEAIVMKKKRKKYVREGDGAVEDGTRHKKQKMRGDRSNPAEV